MSARKLFLTLGLVLVTAALFAAPYGEDGLDVRYTQPGGVDIKLRVYGDEFAAQTEDEQGYTVLFCDSTLTYYYAQRDQSTGVLKKTSFRPGFDNPAACGLNPHEYSLSPAIVPDSVREFYASGAALETNSAPSTVNMSANRSFVRGQCLGDFYGLCVPLLFADDPLEPVVPQQKIDDLFNQVGYHGDGNSGSVYDYYVQQSGGKFRLHTQVTPYFRLPHARSYYNRLDANMFPIMEEIRRSVAEGIESGAIAVDRSKLTLTERGVVAGLTLYFSGETSGVWSRGLWPHATSGRRPIDIGEKMSLGDYQITHIGTAPAIGVLCHELGHLICNFPDFYDYGTGMRNTGDFIRSNGIGIHCLMGSGNNLNAGRSPAPLNPFSKVKLGWGQYVDLPRDKALHLGMSDTVFYRYARPGSKEYYVLENVNRKASPFHRYVIGQGLLVWHVDEAVKTGNELQDMTGERHYFLSVVQADGEYGLELTRAPYYARNYGDATDFFDGTALRRIFSDLTIPSAAWWGDAPSGLNLIMIGKPAESIMLYTGPADGSIPLHVLEMKYIKP